MENPVAVEIELELLRLDTVQAVDVETNELMQLTWVYASREGHLKFVEKLGLANKAPAGQLGVLPQWRDEVGKERECRELEEVRRGRRQSGEFG